MIYDEIYKKFYNVVVNYCFKRIKDKYYAEEVSNKTFHLLWKDWKTLKFPNENALLAWLFKVANLIIKEHKRNKQNHYISLDSEYVLHLADTKAAVDYEEIDSYEEEQKYLEYMSEVKKQLNAQELKLFEMMVISKLPQKQIAIELNTTIAAIKMRWYRLKIRLRQIVKDIIKDNL